MKKTIVIFLLLALCVAMTACGGDDAGSTTVTSLSFSDAVSFEKIKELDGKTVTIIGYMATMSPISGKYMYLMNMPYQSCPFCLPNTTQLSNTMAVYAPDGKTFEYTDQAIKVTGTMAVKDVVDDFGYTYNYLIDDASYEVVDLSTVSDEYALWQAIATDGIVNEINSMFDYLHFLCQWPVYQGAYTDENGNKVSFYMYPADVTNYLNDTGPYGYADKYADTYFPSLIARIRSISSTELEDLVAIIEAAQEKAKIALAELNNGRYTYDEEADCFTLINNDELYNHFYEVYYQFADWLARWEL